jgi:hypothetical protein
MFENRSRERLTGIEDAYIAKVNAAIATDDDHLVEELSAEFREEAADAAADTGDGKAAA